MSSQVSFGDHGVFHRQVFRLAAVGAALGLLEFFLRQVFDLDGSFGRVAWTALLGAGLGLSANPPGRKDLPWSAVVGVGIGLIGALALFGLSTSSPRYPLFGAAVFGAAIGVIAARDLRDFRRYCVPLAMGLSVLLATWVRSTFIGQLGLTEYVPAFVAAPLHGAVFGFLAAIGLVVRQVRLDRDPVVRAFGEIKPGLRGEMLDLCQQAVETHRRIAQALRDREDRGQSTEPRLVRGVEQLVLKVFDLGKRWQEIESDAQRTSAETLTKRIDELEQKIAAATDALARQEYARARDALAAQLGYLRDINRSRERVMARVHGNLATLERLHLAVLNHQGVDMTKFTQELEPLLDEVDEIGVEMDLSSEAMSEAAEVTVGGATRKKGADPGPDPAQVKAGRNAAAYE
jgi:hypothetical protein